jgi:PBP1b-binding outer membrane lipoprotein LpoB
MRRIAAILMLAAVLAGCKESCSPGVQKDQTNPLEGERPGVCKEKK